MKNLPSLIEIKRLRKNLKISQRNLGEALNIPQSTISRIENESIDPPYSKVKKIYDYLANKYMIGEKSKVFAKEIMTHKIISINRRSTLREAVDLMNVNGISQLPILENKQNIGSITAKTIQKVITEDAKLINIEVSLIKELPFPEIDNNWPVKDISDLLLKYPAVLVKERDEYKGIITDSDLFKLTVEN